MSPPQADEDATGSPPHGFTAPPPFGQSVGFLVSQVGAGTAFRFKAVLEDLAIDPRHFALMNALDGGESRSQQVLSDELGIPASSMVTLLDHLEERGFVGRHLEPSDRRVRIVELTASGREVLQRAHDLAMQTELALSAGLSATERDVLIGLLGRIAHNLGLTPGIHPGMGEHHSECKPGS